MLREVPEALEPLTELALDLRWTWSHGADALWRTVDAEAWELHANPWLILQDVPADRLEALARADPGSALEKPVRVPMERAEAIPGVTNGHVWRTELPLGRPHSDYTVRVVPYHRDVLVPEEEWRIRWSR